MPLVLSYSSVWLWIYSQMLLPVQDPSFFGCMTLFKSVIFWSLKRKCEPLSSNLKVSSGAHMEAKANVSNQDVIVVWQNANRIRYLVLYHVFCSLKSSVSACIFPGTWEVRDQCVLPSHEGVPTFGLCIFTKSMAALPQKLRWGSSFEMKLITIVLKWFRNSSPKDWSSESINMF